MEPVSIIIVNYNGKRFLPECLTSVLREISEGSEVIVVDNASSDGSAEFITSAFPSVRLVPLKVNSGFAGGNNAGVQQAVNDLIILLNNDTVVHPGWLKGLVEAVQQRNVPLASSLIKTEGIPERYYEKNGSINFLGYNIMRIFENPTDIFYAGGASLIFRKSVLGLPFDDDYFVYGEDVYLGLRARFMGYDVKHTNESRLDHFGSGTAKHQKSGFLTFYQERNRLLNILLFFSAPTIVKTIPYVIGNLFGKCLLSLLPTKYSFTGIIRAHWWIAAHGRTVMEKRRKIRAQHRVEEKQVIAMMTAKLTNGETITGRWINALSIAYCKIAGLPVRELTR